MIARTEKEILLCKEYLQSKGLKPIADTYVYTTRDGKITACSGVIFTGMIEPFADDNTIDGLEVLGFAQGLIASKSNNVIAMTTNDKVKEILTKRNFHKWSVNTDVFIKGI